MEQVGATFVIFQPHRDSTHCSVTFLYETTVFSVLWSRSVLVVPVFWQFLSTGLTDAWSALGSRLTAALHVVTAAFLLCCLLRNEMGSTALKNSGRTPKYLTNNLVACSLLILYWKSWLPPEDLQTDPKRACLPRVKDCFQYWVGGVKWGVRSLESLEAQWEGLPRSTVCGFGHSYCLACLHKLPPLLKVWGVL